MAAFAHQQINPQQFQGMIASVVPSPDEEVILGKQPVLADYGREVRAAISALPPEISKALLHEYQVPPPQLVAAIEDAIITRELAIDNAAQQNLDFEWLTGGGKGRKADEQSLARDDEWNVRPAP